MKKWYTFIIAASLCVCLFFGFSVNSSAFVSYNAGASIFWKSGVQGFYLSDNSNFLNGTLFEIPSSSIYSSTGVYFDTQFLSNYHNQYVDDGNFHFAYEILNFSQNSQTPLMGSLSSFNHYIAFNRIMYVDPGVTVQFYVVPLSLRYKCSSDGPDNAFWFYTNLLSDVNFGSYEPSAPVNQFIDDQILDYSISVVAQTVNGSNYPRNVYQIIAKNNSSQTVTCTGVRFSFVPSNNITNEPGTPNQNIQLYQSKPYNIGLTMYFSNVIQWFESVETDAVLNELAQIRAQNNRIIENGEQTSENVSVISDKLDDVQQSLDDINNALTTDYPMPQPTETGLDEVREAESAKVDAADDIIDQLEDQLETPPLAAQRFWPNLVDWFVALPYIGTFMLTGIGFVLTRALLGR